MHVSVLCVAQHQHYICFKPAGLATAAAADTNNSSMAMDFELHVKDGGIYWNGNRISMKGCNWFGFETADFALHGLWCAPMERLLDFVAANQFNAIRMPFSAELALNMDDRRPANIDYAVNPGLKGLTTGQVMDKFVVACARRGLLVLLDMHRLAAAKDIPELWFDGDYPEQLVVTAWRTIVLRYKGCPNVFGADINNEPHGAASWGDGSANDWRLAAERLGSAILAANSKLLLLVEGVERNAVCQPGENCWWGGHCAAFKAAPVRVKKDKLVLSPHVYGPDVFNQPYFSDPAFPSNMPEIWDRHFGFVKRERLGPAICPGEWGGWARPGSKDEAWQQRIADWFRANDITDSFYWCLNPNSGDTGGLLQDDWQTANEHKLAIVARAHPNPTVFPAWDDATPVVPTTEQCQAAAAAVGSGQPEPAAAAAPPAADVCHSYTAVAGGAGGAGLLISASIEAKEVSSWDEGGTPVFQTEVKVTNTGGGPASNMRLLVTGAGAELQQSWNGVRLPDADGGWVFGFPDWVAPAGGLAPGASVVVGLITRLARPSGFTLL